jgi:hypothetical protein
MMRLTLPLCLAALSLACVGHAESPKIGADFSFPKGTLNAAVREIGQSYGAKLHVADQALGERPVTIYLRGRKLDDSLRDLASFVEEAPGSCKWSDSEGLRVLREDSAGRTTRMSRNTGRRAARARRLSEDLALALRLGALPDDQLERERLRAPELVHSMRFMRRPLALLAGLNQEQRQGILSGKAITFRIGRACPGAAADWDADARWEITVPPFGSKGTWRRVGAVGLGTRRP